MTDTLAPTIIYDRLHREAFDLVHALRWSEVCSDSTADQPSPCHLLDLAGHFCACIWAIEEAKPLCSMWYRIVAHLDEVITLVNRDQPCNRDTILENCRTLADDLRKLQDTAKNSRFVCTTSNAFTPASAYANTEKIDELVEFCLENLTSFQDSYKRQGRGDSIGYLTEMIAKRKGGPIDLYKLDTLRTNLETHVKRLRQELREMLEETGNNNEVDTSKKVGDSKESPNAVLAKKLSGVTKNSGLWRHDFVERCFAKGDKEDKQNDDDDRNRGRQAR